jgi:cobalt/nickel transport protein
MEQWIGGELPSEMESLLFCVQTGIGVGILFFALGRMYERKKLGKDQQDL